MSKKKIVVAVVVVAVILLAGLVIWRVLGKGSGLKLGMSYDKVMAFIKEHNYEYTQWGPEEDDKSISIHFVGDDVEINGIQGECSISFSEEDGLLEYVCFYIRDITSQDDFEKKAEIMKDYATEHYGELVLNPDAGGEYFKCYYVHDSDMTVIFQYPVQIDGNFKLSLIWKKGIHTF